MFEGLGLLWTIIVGGIAGWLADQVVPGVKVGLLGAIIAGILGGIVGGWIFGLLGLPTDGLLVLVGAVIGAIVVLVIYRAIAKK